MRSTFTLILIALMVAMAIFGIGSVVVACQMSAMHGTGANACPQAFDAFVHHIALFVGLSAVFGVFFAVLIPRFLNIVRYRLKISFPPPKEYIHAVKDRIVFSLPAQLFSTGILNRKDAPAFSI